MLNFKWTCKDCAFAQIKDNKQVGCDLNKLDKIWDGKDLYEFDGKGFAQYERFCTGFRPDHWIKENNIGTQEAAIGLVKTENSPKIGYVVYFDDNLKDLKTTLLSIQKPEYVVIINRRVEFNEEIFALCNETLDCKFLLMQFVADLDKDRTFDEAFKKCKNGYIAFIDAGYKFTETYFDRIDRCLNVDMERLGIVIGTFERDIDRCGLLLVQAKIYQFLGGGLPKIMEDGSIDKDTFFERVEKAKKSDPNLVRNWGEFFNG